jgi:hypothetical protein
VAVVPLVAVSITKGAVPELQVPAMVRLPTKNQPKVLKRRSSMVKDAVEAEGAAVVVVEKVVEEDVLLTDTVQPVKPIQTKSSINLGVAMKVSPNFKPNKPQPKMPPSNKLVPSLKTMPGAPLQLPTMLGVLLLPLMTPGALLPLLQMHGALPPLQLMRVPVKVTETKVVVAEKGNNKSQTIH